jgi:hypothetical protein
MNPGPDVSLERTTLSHCVESPRMFIDCSENSMNTNFTHPLSLTAAH